MVHPRLLVLATLMLVSVASADDKTFSLADLKSLVDSGSFREAWMHIGDVPPSQRKGDWVDVAAAAAGGALATLDSDDGSTIQVIDQIDKDYPQLLKSAKYAKPRAELGFKGIEGCLRQTGGYRSSYGIQECAKLGLRFIDNSSGDRALALKIAKIARASGAGAVQFFKRTVGGKDLAACKDEDLQLAVVDGLRHPGATDARALMVTCWAEIKEPALEALYSDHNRGYVHENTCEHMLATKAIKGLQAKRCMNTKKK